MKIKFNIIYFKTRHFSTIAGKKESDRRERCNESIKLIKTINTNPNLAKKHSMKGDVQQKSDNASCSHPVPHFKINTSKRRTSTGRKCIKRTKALKLTSSHDIQWQFFKFNSFLR